MWPITIRIPVAAFRKCKCNKTKANFNSNQGTQAIFLRLGESSQSQNPVVAIRNRKRNKINAKLTSKQHDIGILPWITESLKWTQIFRSSLRFPPASHVRVELRGLFAGHGQRTPIPCRASRAMLRQKDDLPHVV
jgi:hypothetical protein